ncbi:helix-turn-helix domain-containing protein [Nocardiopsis chromatogenes]|uniref:helix-turn-helix domain-containing protein n=1 Tax=Nocardiopsis chromatogenes TaxID=280239 RepID=UPI000477BFA4|nr:helix-turn-helix transcriptional regulator [Nocardiopsis chromatogenes]
MAVPPEAARRKFGLEVRRRREKAGLPQKRLADTVPMSQSMLSGIELGQKTPKREFVAAIDHVLTAGGALLRKWDAMASADGFPDWFRDVAELERQATEIWEYHPLLIPGLLQTEEYIAAIIRSGNPAIAESELGEQVRARLKRQEVLQRNDAPLLLAVLDELWLHRAVGSREIMRGQMERLVEASESPRVTIQVVPGETLRHPGHDGAFKLITVPERGQVVYTETRASGYSHEDDETIEDYTRVFADLRGAALPEEASRNLLGKIVEEYE